MIIGLDLGTSKIAAILYETDVSSVVAVDSLPNNCEIKGLPVNYHEQDPELIFDIAIKVIHNLLKKAEVKAQAVRGIAITGQQHGVILVDKDLKPITSLITWQDRRAADISENIRLHQWPEETGCFLHPGYGGLTLYHLKQAGKIPHNTYKALSITGFVVARLTGQCAIDETFAASWGIFDIRKMKWKEELIRLLGIEDSLLPDFGKSCSAVGVAKNARQFGLSENTIIYSPVGDNQAGVAGVLDSNLSEAVINIGTSGQLSVPLKEFGFSPQVETRPYPGGSYIQMHATLCGGWSYEYLAGFFSQVLEQIGQTKVPVNEIMNRMNVYGKTLESNGLSMDTRFAGERIGSVKAGNISGINTINLSPENLIHACIKGVVEELAMASVNTDFTDIKGLVAAGNAIRKIPLLKTSIEERFGLPCRIVDLPEEAALGAVKLVLKNKL
jgi:sedoheptulokinase